MPQPRNLPHILLTRAPDAPLFTSPKAGGGKTRTKPQDREAHGNRLREQYRSALPRAAEKATNAVRLEFESEPGFDLHLKSLDPAGNKTGIELLNVREEATADGTVVKATVLVPREKLGHFDTVFRDYLTKTRAKTERPVNRALVESIGNVRRASLKSLWTDKRPLPDSGETTWWEVWLRRSATSIERFRQQASRMNLMSSKLALHFVDRSVLNLRATAEQLSDLIVEDDLIAELRYPTISTAEFMELHPKDQGEFAHDLVMRLVPAESDSPAVCILDTGVARGHPLLAPALPLTSWLSLDPARWEPDDSHGHGTQMAGLALFGDLAPVMSSSDPVLLTHGLESVKLFPEPGDTHSYEAYGAVTAEAVSRIEVEVPLKPRVICMAVTSTEQLDRGRPTSWSSAVDKLAFGDGEPEGPRRLFCVSAGNADMANFARYPASNATDPVNDPAQAWNVLTIGAYADRDIISEPSLGGWKPVARVGDLCPSSTTSVTWDDTWPIKPELVLPGGNAALDHAGSPDFTDSLSLLTTNHQPMKRHLTISGETSAATALASRMAARIHAVYPELWPETIRGLMVHSAEWTPEMLGYLPKTKKGKPKKNPRKDEIERQLLRVFGYGVPDENAALFSGRDALTLIRQDELQPFDKPDSRPITKDMHFYALPWPEDELRRLGEVDVELRVTLSYFIEPLPGERGYMLNQRHRYASHGLRFDMKTGEETVEQFKRRVNKAARADGEKATSKSDSKRWRLGSDLRSKGSLHIDRWTGPAVELAAKKCLAVYPVVGWWRERPKFDRWRLKVRYSIIVSIRTPETEVDIYTPVAIQLGVPVDVET